MRLIYSALLLLLYITACAPGPKIDVEKRARALFEVFKAKDYDAATKYYSSEFYKIRDEEMWRKELRTWIEEYGDITQVTLRNKQADTRFSGKFYIYQFDTLHGKKRVRHTLTYVLKVDSGELELVGHQIKKN